MPECVCREGEWLSCGHTGRKRGAGTKPHRHICCLASGLAVLRGSGSMSPPVVVWCHVDITQAHDSSVDGKVRL